MAMMKVPCLADVNGLGELIVPLSWTYSDPFFGCHTSMVALWQTYSDPFFGCHASMVSLQGTYFHTFFCSSVAEMLSHFLFLQYSVGADSARFSAWSACHAF